MRNVSQPKVHNNCVLRVGTAAEKLRWEQGPNSLRKILAYLAELLEAAGTQARHPPPYFSLDYLRGPFVKMFNCNTIKRMHITTISTAVRARHVSAHVPSRRDFFKAMDGDARQP